MAIKNRGARAGEFVPRGAEPGLTRRFVWRDADQEKAVRDIAQSRFNFPSPVQPGLKTYTNRPERQIGVRIPSGDLVFPDIVVVDRDTSAKMVAEVESHRTIRENEMAALAEKWRAFTGLGDFYLFVPLMQVENVRGIIKRFNLPRPKLRGWRYIAGQDLLDIAEL